MRRILLLFLFSISSFYAKGQFSGDFSPSKWTFSSTTPGGDGRVDVTGAPNQIVLHGSDNNTGSSDGKEDYKITIPSNGYIQFDYSHYNYDIDQAFYLINNTPVLIASKTSSGTSCSIAVKTGDTFGFRVHNYDNCCGRGILTVSNFKFTTTPPVSPPISLHPSNTSTCSGIAATFSAGSPQSNVTYKWQVSTDNGESFTNISNNTIYSGTSTSTLTISGATTTYNNYQYRAVISDKCSLSSNTNPATLTVFPLPGVTASASATTILIGDEVTLTGSGAASYSWDQGVTNGVAFSPVNTLTYTVTGTDANGCKNTAQVTVTVNKKIQHIVFEAIGDKVFGTAAFDLTATASSGLPVSFTVVSGPATISGQTLTITGAGSIKVKASHAGNEEYQAANEEQTFTVEKASQTITFDAIPDKILGDAPFSLHPTASSGLAVVLSVISGPATLSGNTLTLTGTGEVKIKASQIGNENYQAASEVERTFIIRNPAVATALSIDRTPTNRNPISVKIDFDEEVADFDINDLSVAGGEKSNFNGQGTQYTMDITPTAEGTITVDVAAEVAETTDGRKNLAAVQLAFVYDSTDPTVVVSTTLTSPSNSSSLPITITFSEEVYSFDEDDLIIQGGTLSQFSGSGKTYTVNVMPTEDGIIAISVPAQAAQDEAQNWNQVSNTLEIESDRTAPEVMISSSLISAPNSARIPFSIQFSEAVTGFDQSDITVTGATLSNFSGSGDRYTVDLSPLARGVIGIQVAAEVAKDASNNENKHSNYFYLFYDGSVHLAAIGNQQIDEHALLQFTATTTRPEVQDLTSVSGNVSTASYSTVYATAFNYTLEGNVPSGATIDAATGVFNWTPTEAQGPETYTFKVKATNVYFPDYSDEETISITVNEVNSDPVFTSTAEASVLEDQTYTYTVAATDEDLPANTLTYAAVTLPAWMNFNPNTQILSGTPDNSRVGFHPVKLSVNDGIRTIEQEFSVEVINVNDAPVISEILPVTSHEDQLVTVNFEIHDVDNDLSSLQLKATSGDHTLVPASAISFTGTGKIRTLNFTPVKDAFGGPIALTVEVSDGDLSASTQFQVIVLPLNDAPHMDAVANREIRINSPKQTLTLTGLQTGPANENNQQLALSVVSDNPELITAPEIKNNLDGTATLTFMPVQSQTLTGTATLAITLRDNGGTERGGVDATTVRFQVIILPTNNTVFLPNMFTPNGDGSNEAFWVMGEGIRQINFRIFNKMGVMVYETSNLEQATSSGWDGTYQGQPQPAGVYTWQIVGSFADGSPLQFEGKKAGSVLLTR